MTNLQYKGLKIRAKFLPCFLVNQKIPEIIEGIPLNKG
jgi:hypothetical protein